MITVHTYGPATNEGANYFGVCDSYMPKQQFQTLDYRNYSKSNDNSTNQQTKSTKKKRSYDSLDNSVTHSNYRESSPFSHSSLIKKQQSNNNKSPIGNRVLL